MPLCRQNPEMWFSDLVADVRRAKEICNACPLQAPCAEHGIRHERWGTWGGLTRYERHRIRRSTGIVLHEPQPPSGYPRKVDRHGTTAA